MVAPVKTRCNKNGIAGFTLVEVVVAMGILMIVAFLSISVALTTISQSSSSSIYRAEAEQVLKDLLDTTAKQDYTLVVTRNGNVTRRINNNDVTFFYNISVSPVPGSSFAKTVNATVSWNINNQDHSISSTTVVTQQ